MTTIDMTPTAEETVRIYAYILASHGDLSPYDFGNYWSYTERESEIIVTTYKLWDNFSKAWQASGLPFEKLPLSTRSKFIKSALQTATTAHAPAKAEASSVKVRRAS
jgi:hypothetical protein